MTPTPQQIERKSDEIALKKEPLAAREATADEQTRAAHSSGVQQRSWALPAGSCAHSNMIELRGVIAPRRKP